VLFKEGARGPSNIAVEMSSSTIAATPRFVLRRAGNSAGPPSRWRCAGPSGGEHRPSSPAGLYARPWLQRLRRALREDLFVLHYQPIAALECGEVSHHEALVRLADEPGGELVAPGSFLPAAERYGLVCEIDRLVVGRVAALLGAQPPPEGAAKSVLRVAVNLSALSVTDRGMLSHIERELDRHRVDPRRLVLEITETAAISDIRRAQTFCAGAQALGCAIALDDFGVGFGSFYYAKRLPFRYLKIDGDFIRGLRSSHEDRLMVKAIADVASGMGRQTIAEFVGDEPTMELLRELGVDYAQGFHVGRPRPLALA
jgi:EAL domain-containing protein (putative c-di-GMP-specific phosphodiesterase class I)